MRCPLPLYMSQLRHPIPIPLCPLGASLLQLPHTCSRINLSLFIHMLSSQRHPLLARSPPDKTLSLALSGNPLQLTPFPSELLPVGILWQPGQGFPYPEGSISPPLTPACFKGSGPVLCSQRQGWCLGQDVGR